MNDVHTVNEDFAQSVEETSTGMSKRSKVILGAAGLALVGIVAWAGLTVFGGASSVSDGASAVGSANAAATNISDKVLASVDGKEITELEVGGLLQQGVDKAIVIDRYINKVLAAELGRQKYIVEAAATLKAAEREVLSTLYTARRMDELRKDINDEQIKAYYDTNVLDQNFMVWKVNYYLSADAADIQKTLASLKSGDKDALAQLKPLVDQGDGFATAAALPYNLGRVVSKMKKGELSEVLQLRNGLLILKVEDSKQLEKPTLEEIKQEIIQAIATQKFNDELEQVRKKAKVALG